MTTSPLQALALVVGASMLASGSAYAGATLAKNSVGSPQVINGSLTHKDIKDGTLRASELMPGAAPRTYTFIGPLPEGSTEVLDIPGFSRFTFSCSGSNVGLVVSFGDDTPEPSDPWQRHGISASDVVDNSPSGGATITGHAGGAGFTSSAGGSPGSGILVRGDYWGRADQLLAHGTFSWGYPGVPCWVNLQVVVDRLKQADPIPHRVVPGRGAVCRETGTATCLTDAS